MKKIASSCADSTCPTVWQHDDPNLVVVQGYVVSSDEMLTELSMPEGESAVVIPKSLFDSVGL